jgi:magnesium-transporting ATPase (P-type)
VSRIERRVNYIVGLMLLILTALVLVSLGLHYNYSVSDIESDPLSSIVLFILLYNSIIPISLFVVMDLVKVLQMYFI